MFHNFLIRANVLCLSILLTVICVSAASGDLDLTFGNGGKVITPVGNSQDFASSIAIQADGKIVVAGESGTSPNTDFAVVRYNTDGTLDNTFGAGGKVITPISQANDRANSVVVQADGKIIAGGYSGTFQNTDFTLVRYNPNGTLDNSFGSGGIVVTLINNSEDSANSIAIQSNGKIVAAGFSGNFPNFDFAVNRYNTDGSLDASFDGDGKAITSFGGGLTWANAVAIQANGKIVAAGTAQVSGNGNDFALVRYNIDGSLDTSFDGDGKVTTALRVTFADGDVINAIAIDVDGKIVAVGGGGGFIEGAFALVRYNTDGSLDTSFGMNGRVITSFNIGGFASGIAIQKSDGKIVAVGGIFDGQRSSFVVIRYNTDGSLDTSFGSSGRVITPLGDFSSASAVAIQSDEKIVVAGSATSGTDSDFALVRYRGNSSLVRTKFDFDGDGKADIAVFRPSNGSWYRLNSSDNSFFSVQFGLGTDRIAPADYDGDGKTDIAVFRPPTANPFLAFFYILNSSNGMFRTELFGGAGSLPASGDWDGDGQDDVAVHTSLVGIPENPPSSLFSYRPSLNNGTNAVSINAASDGISVANDYDGDGKMDAAVFRPADGVWVIRQSSNNQLRTVRFGLSSDIPVPADYDGDGKTNLAVFRPSNGVWYRLNSNGSDFDSIHFGISTDRPVPADYDGDGKADIAVYRLGTWYLLRSTAGFTAVQFGLRSDVPVPSAYIRDN